MKEASPIRHNVDSVRKKIERRLGYRRPFVIRSHHLENLIGIHDATYSTIAQETVDAVVGDDDRGYIEDVRGTTPQEASRSESAITKFFRDFDNLPIDSPVKIISGKKDDICNGCAVGVHCTSKYNVEGDINVFNDFLYTSDILGMSKEIKVRSDVTYAVDSKPLKVQAAHTTARVVKAVLEVWALDQI